MDLEVGIPQLPRIFFTLSMTSGGWLVTSFARSADLNPE
jgi:hypothetical protein